MLKPEGRAPSPANKHRAKGATALPKARFLLLPLPLLLLFALRGDFFSTLFRPPTRKDCEQGGFSAWVSQRATELGFSPEVALLPPQWRDPRISH